MGRHESTQTLENGGTMKSDNIRLGLTFDDVLLQPGANQTGFAQSGGHAQRKMIVGQYFAQHSDHFFRHGYRHRSATWRLSWRNWAASACSTAISDGRRTGAQLSGR
jgi:hypothetical protein